MTEKREEELVEAIRALTAEVRANGHSNGNGKSKFLTVDTAIKLGLLFLAAVLAYQRALDKVDFLTSRVTAIELWQDTQRQVTGNQDRRLAILEKGADPGAITIKRR